MLTCLQTVTYLIGTTAAAPPGIALAGKEVVHDKPTAEAGSVTAAASKTHIRTLNALQKHVMILRHCGKCACTQRPGLPRATAVAALSGSRHLRSTPPVVAT